ncbi:RNA polymerase II-binding domain-containing protein [Calycina marina]|uniref:RNA polymerase II-binding domain-containing protein n=1 Tax=Calycina marina TaxID=1763456 RepID=A0A9P8CEB2_9HELO|nr:RNA polymerase II-binding domain-containing protein [Calycina marina]
MAYTDDAVLAKLSALNETQESIVTVAQWVMFHRRQADRTGQLWLQRLKDSSSNKRLNLIYLANEVAQQSKARHREEFLMAFSPVIAEATAAAYRGASSDIQGKLRRVVDVWRSRQIFEIPIQDAIEARIEELDKTRSASQKSGGGSLFGGSKSDIPNELAPLLAPQRAITKYILASKTPVQNAKSEYEKMMDPKTPVPIAPVRAARLNGLLKTLVSAEVKVADCIKARKSLIEGLEKMLSSNQATLLHEEAQLKELSTRKDEIDAKKREVEDGILRNHPATPSDSPGLQQNLRQTPAPEPDRPDVEALTPPPVAAAPPAEEPPPLNLGPASAAGADLLSSLSGSHLYGSGGYDGYASGGSLKKRKLNPGEEIPDFGDEIDAEVTAMLQS